MNLLVLVKVQGVGYQIYYVNGVYMGDFVCEVDGYFVWYPNDFRGGCLSAEFCRAIADELDSLNSEWNKQVQQGLGEANARLDRST